MSEEIPPATLARRFHNSLVGDDAWSEADEGTRQELIDAFAEIGPLFASVVHDCCVTTAEAATAENWTVSEWHPGNANAPYRIIRDADGNEVAAVFGDEATSQTMADRLIAGAAGFRTTEEWCRVLDWHILDYDGWRDPTAPDRDTPISRDEFERRFRISTVAIRQSP